MLYICYGKWWSDDGKVREREMENGNDRQAIGTIIIKRGKENTTMQGEKSEDLDA